MTATVDDIPNGGDVAVVDPMDIDKDDGSVPTTDAPKEPEEDPKELYARKASQFLKELHKFHENAGTPIVRHPKINGKDVDLYELYTEMTKLGGWVKVNTRNDWDELLENLNFPKSCVNAAVAIKYIYIRYLDRYEKLHFLGEEVERVDEDDEDVRQKKLNTRYLHNVPMTYNHGQHYVSEANRLAHKLSTDYYRPTQNEKLFLSLLSPLPNEQNFALNVCMLISNEPVATFVHLDKCPKLIDALLAHAGVYSHYSLRDIFTEFYSNYRKHSLQTFWNDCLSEKPHILELSFGDISESLDGEIVCLDDKESEEAQEAAQHEIISSFLNLKRGSGTQDYIGLRVQQIATILRNLSFVEENTFLFAHSRTFLRFLVMCSNVRWNNLHHMALDMLGNIAEDIELSDPVTDDLTRCLLSTVMDGLESEDRGVIISCMEVLYKLCRRPNNEEYLYRAFDQSMYQKITSFLWLKDAMLVMYTLECMYALTNMGEKTCNGFVHVRGIMDSLVSLVTLEAKTFGQEGCILMCVVDKQLGTVPTTTVKPVVAPNVTIPANPQITNSPVKASAVPVKPPVVMSQASVVTPQKVNVRTTSATGSTPKPPLTPKQTQQQANHENEQNAQEWLRSSYELGEAGVDRVDMQELYKQYVTSMSKMKRGGVVSPAFFPKVVKLVFGPTPGPIRDQGPPFYTGIRPKAVAAPSTTSGPKPGQVARVGVATAGAPQPGTIIQQVTPDGTHVITTVAAVQAAAAAAAEAGATVMTPKTLPIATTSSGMTITPVMVSGSVITTSPQKKQLPPPAQPQQQQQQIIRPVPAGPQVIANPASSSTSQAPSSLIKSLLANKVTTVATGPVIGARIQSPGKTSVQQQTKSPFLINHATNTNPVAIATMQPPPAGAVAAASVIMSSVAAAQSARPTTATVPINNSSNAKLLQVVSPQKTMAVAAAAGNAGVSVKSNSHPPLILSSPSNSSTNNSPNVIASNAMNVRQVAQRQQLQKQKEMAQRNLMATGLVATGLDPSQPPPLAPLSSGPSQKVTLVKINSTSQGVAGGTPVIITTKVPTAEGQGGSTTSATISLAHQLDGMTPPFGDDDEEDEAKQQSKIASNKMLTDLLEKKSDPPTFAGEGGSSGSSTSSGQGKRKLSSEGNSSASKRKTTAAEEPAIKATPSAANLYAEMAASILEDDESVEDETEEEISMEEDQLAESGATLTIKAGAAAAPSAQPSVINLPVRQQIIMPTNANSQQVILTGSHPGQTGTATIKTESGYQTVPILVQQQQQQPGSSHAVAAGASGSPIIQQRPAATAVHAGQTQYVLATNPQGQTYVMATQSPMQQQMGTLLVTQTAQQQGTQQKTIIILQQQPNQGPGVATGVQQSATPIQQAINNQGQKIIMTTAQGQQVVLTGPGGSPGVGISQPQRQIVIQQAAPHPQGSNIVVQSAPGGVATGGGATVQKQIVLSTGAGQPTTQFAVKAPAPLDAIQSADNIPQHIIKTSTGLQIKPVHMQSQVQPQGVQVTSQKATAGGVIQGSPGITMIKQVATSPQIPIQATSVPVQSNPVLSGSSTPILTSSASSSPVPPPSVASPKPSTIGMSTVTTSEGTITVTTTTTPTPPPVAAPVGDNGVDINWPYVCDWRGCPRKKFKNADEVFYHACKAHCPDTLDFDAEIFCQWGSNGQNLCDGKARKRFSLMTHFQDRHCTEDKLAAAVQRRLEKGLPTGQPAHPITIIRDVTKDGEAAAAAKKEEDVSAPAAPGATNTTTTKKAGKPGTWQPTAEAVSIIKRREFKDSEFTKAWKDDNEGPVSISIRLTASLILRNLVTYSDVAKRMLKSHESHLSQIALSNVESSRTVAQVLYEMNDFHPV